ncbi:MAG: hypothetical protein ACP5N2_03430 [Candidatus Nanoarchaeia archaeon]
MDKTVYPGKTITQMPLLISAGQIPITFYDELERRVAALKTEDEKIINKVCNQICDTSDVIFTGADGSIKIQLDSEIARGIDDKILLYEGGIRLTDKAYDNLEGVVHLRKGTFEHMLKGDYFKEKDLLAKDEPSKRNVIRILARDDADLLIEYFRLGIAYLKNKGYPTEKLMGLQIKTKTIVPIGFLVSIEEIQKYGSPVYANHKLTDSGGRLVGKLPTLHLQ